MYSKDLLIGGFVVGILYLLSKKCTPGATNQNLDVTLRTAIEANGSPELMVNGGGQYKAIISSDLPIQGSYVKGSKGDGLIKANFNFPVTIQDDNVKNWSQLNGIKLVNGGGIPLIF